MLGKRSASNLLNTRLTQAGAHYGALPPFTKRKMPRDENFSRTRVLADFPYPLGPAALEPALPFEIPEHQQRHAQEEAPSNAVSVQPVQFLHVVKVHAPDTGQEAEGQENSAQGC